MFELIRANKRRSMVLVMLMLLLLLALGFVIGSAVVPSVSATRYQNETLQPGFRFDPTGGFIGIGIAFCLWMVQSIIAYFQGGNIMLAVSRARPIEKSDHPVLFNVVEEMTIAAQLPRMPKVYVIDDMALNAFATGRGPDNAAVAVTAGLLGRMNRDQLQGVVAHEISHIVNRDVLFMTMVGIMLGTIVMISEVFLRSMWYGAAGGRRYSSDSRKGGGAQGVMMVLAIVLAILTPIVAQLIYFACSRRREFLADAGAAVYTRYPEGLASALEALAQDPRPLASANRATAPMYITNPLEKGQAMALSLTSTHPPINDRIRILRSMAGGASYQDYQAAWVKVRGREAKAMPKSALAMAGGAIREAHPDADRPAPDSGDPRQRMREAGDLLRNLNQFVFLSCVCGLRIKLPPDFKQDHLACPRCHRTLEVPAAHLAALAGVGEQLQASGPGEALPVATPMAPQPPLEIVKRGKEWMSFKCSCGTVKTLAPSCQADHTFCTKCGRKILIHYAAKV
jgi:heat shock protein HtpX